MYSLGILRFVFGNGSLGLLAVEKLDLLAAYLFDSGYLAVEVFYRAASGDIDRSNPIGNSMMAPRPPT